MNIVIAGCGNVGLTIAKKLISENHNVTIIEQSEEVVNRYRNDLDALFIEGDAVNIKVLKDAGIQNASLYLAVTSNDNTNIVSAQLARKLAGDNELIIVAKVENTPYYFNYKTISPKDFNIDFVIDPKQLTINKIISLINCPEALEVITYANKQVELIGLSVSDSFSLFNQTLLELNSYDENFNSIRIVAIHRNDNIIIPRGNDCILKGDKVYIVGKKENIRNVINKHFNSNIKINNVVVVGNTLKAKDLALRLKEERFSVSMIIQDSHVAELFAEDLDGILIVNGSATDQSVLSEIRVENSCFVCISDDDEYNIISAVTARKNKASKAISVITNIELVSIINSMPYIDAVFSPHRLSVGEILKFCRKGNILSVFNFSEINAETMDVEISEEIAILNKPIKTIKFPNEMIIGVIIRDDQVIIPTGDDVVMLNDKLIVFLTPNGLSDTESIFNHMKGNK